MKKLITSIFYLLMICIAISSCENGENTPSNITVSNPEELNQVFNSGESNGTIHFEAQNDWNASVSTTSRADESWIDINPKSGKAGKNQVINITMSKNVTGEDRTATITITCGDTTITITVRQSSSTEGDGNIDQGKAMITQITAYGIKYNSNEKVKLYETSLQYKDGILVKTSSEGSYENYSTYTFKQDYSYDPDTKTLKIESNEKSEHQGSSSNNTKRLENWNIQTNEQGYVVSALGKIYINDKHTSDVTNEYTYDSEGHLATYYFFQKNNDGNNDGPSNSTFIWNDGNLSEMKDNESGESWMKAEYGEELNNDIFDLNQLMCDGSYPEPDYTAIITKMGKQSKNLQTKYYYYYETEISDGEGETSRATESGYEAIEISYEKDENGRISVIKYKHPDKVNKPNYSETMLVLSYSE